MAKIVIQHDIDAAIGMILEEVPAGTPGVASGAHGKCTECPHTIHRWDRDNAIAAAKKHVDSHVAQVKGIDPSSVVSNPAVDHELMVGCNID